MVLLGLQILNCDGEINLLFNSFPEMLNHLYDFHTTFYSRTWNFENYAQGLHIKNPISKRKKEVNDSNSEEVHHIEFKKANDYTNYSDSFKIIYEREEQVNFNEKKNRNLF